MNKFTLACLVLLLIAAFGGPAIKSTSGSASIETLSGIVSLAGAGLALISGIMGIWKLKISSLLKGLGALLVLALSAGSILLAALMF